MEQAETLSRTLYMRTRSSHWRYCFRLEQIQICGAGMEDYRYIGQQDLEKRVIVECLAEANSNVNCLDKDGLTPLILAAMGNKHDIIRVLLDFSADVNIRDAKYGQSAVSFAAEKGEYIPR